MRTLIAAENTRRATPESDQFAADLVKLICGAEFGERAMGVPNDAEIIRTVRARMAARQRMSRAWCNR
jgi:hypothetical protein